MPGLGLVRIGGWHRGAELSGLQVRHLVKVVEFGLQRVACSERYPYPRSCRGLPRSSARADGWSLRAGHCPARKGGLWP